MKAIIIVGLVLLFVVSCAPPQATEGLTAQTDLGVGDTSVEDLEDLQADLDNDVSFEEVDNLTLLD